jgi:hypothetical protein
MHLARFTPFLILLPLPLLKQVALFCFHTSVWGILNILTLLYPLHSPSPHTNTHSQTRPIHIPVHHVFICIVIVQGGFMSTWIYCTLTRLTHFLTLSFPIPYHPIIQQLSVCFTVPSSHTDAVYFNIIDSLSFSFPLTLPHSPPNSPTITSMSHVYSYISISKESISSKLKALY